MDYNQNDPLGRQEQHIYVPAAPTANSPQTSAKTNAFAIASLICGICSVVFCCAGILSIPLGALGILFSIFSLQKGKSTEPISITGLIVSIIGLVLGLLMSVYIVAAYLADPDYYNGNRDYFNNYYDDGFYDDYDDYYDDFFDDHHDDHYYDHYYDNYDDFDDYFRNYYRDYYDDYYDDFYDYGFEFL